MSTLAEGLGIRAVARGFEGDPNTMLHWLMEAADHAAAFSRDVLHDVQVSQVHLDERLAWLRAVKDGEVSEAEVSQRVSRSLHWVWVAIDPVRTRLWSIDVGERTWVRAQGVVHQVGQVLAPDDRPLFLTDGLKAYATALRTHFGSWVQRTE